MDRDNHGADATDIRPATPADGDVLWPILQPVFRAGETYPIDRAITRDDALAFWLGPDRRTFLALTADRPVGSYYLRANNAGGGAHVCNCGYAVARDAQGRGVARRMAEHSFAEARAAGFTAMQFNFVIASNRRALRLWVSLGFATVGRLPRAFAHPTLGLVDAFVMRRDL